MRVVKEITVSNNVDDIDESCSIAPDAGLSVSAEPSSSTTETVQTILTATTPVMDPAASPSSVTDTQQSAVSGSCVPKCRYRVKYTNLQRTTQRLKRKVAEMKQSIKELQSVSSS